MAEGTPNTAPPETPPALEQGTYEILRARLAAQGTELRTRLEQLNRARQEVFGAIPTALLATERITTPNNCLARDLIPLGGQRFLFGYNVHLGLRSEIQLADVFGLYELRDHRFAELPLTPLADERFLTDFRSLYHYYRHTVFAKFSLDGPFLFMVFRVGKAIPDIKTFKWHCQDGRLTYVGNRFDHEYRYPPTHEFEWTRTHRELHRSGLHPHIAIEDRVFVECVGGDLTVKVEDNTTSGEGIYSEPVEQKDQTLDDAEIYYAVLGSLILLKIRPYQEPQFRYLVFNEKLKEVRRIDALAEACVLLPDQQGIVFPRGYYLQSGECKLFETALTDMVFYKRIVSPNGEDVLYTFYNRLSGHYVLLSYNLIARTVETPIVCGGFSLFDNGEMALFRVEDEPQRHHALQIWQTPYLAQAWQPDVPSTSYLRTIGNPELVRAMAECQEVLTLLGKDDTYGDLYLDLVRRTADILDTYFWLDRPDTFRLREPLHGLHETAAAALAEFDKVLRLRRTATQTLQQAVRRVTDLLRAISQTRFERLADFVQRLHELRALRGELLSLRDVRYLDVPTLDQHEQKLAAETTRLSERAVAFLLQPQALDPARARIDQLRAAVPGVAKVTEATALEQELNTAAAELDLLTETVTNLKIQDATEATRIVEDLSALYAVLNQARAALKQRLRELRGVEAQAEFASQARLLEQALANYLDLATTPPKCDEFLNRLLVQVEELEARFADFEEFVVQLAEQRTAFAAAFEARKLELVEARNRRANGLLAAAERILKAITHRAASFTTPPDLNGYFATDAMVEKVRDLIRQLLELGDSVKAEDLQTRLKTVQEDAVRQLKDRQDLFAGGPNLLQLGRHQFRVNTQELSLTMVPRGDALCLHITGTSFFEPATDPELLATRPVWGLESASETPAIYRGEFLAYRILNALEAAGTVAAAAGWTDDERLAHVRAFMATRFTEGYAKGVHDLDAARLLGALLELHQKLGPLRHPPPARACAAVFWSLFPEGEEKALLRARLESYGQIDRLFPGRHRASTQIAELQERLADFLERTGLFAAEWAAEAAVYLHARLTQGAAFVVSPGAAALVTAFQRHLQSRHSQDAFTAACQAVERDPVARYVLVRDWVRGFALQSPGGAGVPPALPPLGGAALQPAVPSSGGAGFQPARGSLSLSLPATTDPTDSADEAAWLLLDGTPPVPPAQDVVPTRTLEGLVGNHPRLSAGRLPLHYHEFTRRLARHFAEVVPLFEQCQARKRHLVAAASARFRLDDFKPRVLTSFVRNRLIDSVYLPLVGDNLAKQLGAAGNAKRTDRMGLLLLLSPPGYGKTTLMEYLAHRLGIVFVKISGPAIGPRVTSLDPAEAPNAAAREELRKLNFAFALGDNLMLCLDDIQHLHPEFLQKFIPLCDAQRQVEGVDEGQARTFDLRGKQVAVVMAGNPYTESGERFRIPDMLANRADTYNLGDVLAGREAAFHLSYLENATGSNPLLARLLARQPQDLHPLLQLAGSGSREGLEFAGSYSPEELADAVSVLRKLTRIRDVVLRVNAEYIRSASQAEAYRTEPPFHLQGSYRNMNRLAEQVAPLMNDAELETLLQNHYRNEAQTLTKGAESNLLKFRELTGTLTPDEAARWDDIRKTFRRNLLLHQTDDQDPVGRVVGQLATFSHGLEDIKDVLADGLRELPRSVTPPPPPPPPPLPPPPPVTLIITPAAPSAGFPPPPSAIAPGATVPPAPSSHDAPGGGAGVPPAPVPSLPETAVSVTDGIREVRITSDTLRKIWEVIERQPPPQPDQPPAEGDATIRMPKDP